MSWKRNLTITTLLAGATAIGIHMINKTIYLSATLDNLLNCGPETYYEWKFGKIYYTKQGEGSPVLLIHDTNTYSSAYEWNKLIHKLSQKHQVYALDLLGCGRSDKPNLTYTNFLYVQMVTDFIKNVIKTKADIIISGDSCPIALGVCQGDDKIINNIIMINPPDIHTAARIPSKRTKTLSKLIQLPLVGTLLYNMLTKRSDIDLLFRTKYFYQKNKVTWEEVRTYYESAHEGNSSSKYLFASLAGNYLTVNIPHWLEALNNSIFILTGDEEVYVNIAEEYKTLLPSIESSVIKESKYLPQLERPEAVLNQILLYLSNDTL